MTHRAGSKTGNGRSHSITTLQEATQVDHVRDGNEAATGRKAYVLTETITRESHLMQRLNEPGQTQIQHCC
jgi:hypothetical protein